MAQKKILWTHTDEAPMLATFSFLPVIQAIVKSSNITVEMCDISLAARILATFPAKLKDAQKVEDTLAMLGKLVKKPAANIIKLPNISASVPQLKEAIEELQAKGYKVPDYPEAPKTDAEKKIHDRYGKCLGSAVNPVLREGNSDRRAAKAVKEFAKKHPHTIHAFDKDSKTHVASMDSDDFYASETTWVAPKAQSVKFVLVAEDGTETVLLEKLPLLEGEVLDASSISATKLRSFYEAQLQDAKKNNVMVSLHLKATMMKKSDPVMFGHMVSVFLKDVFEKYESEFAAMGVDPNQGLGDLYDKIDTHEKKDAIKADIDAAFKARPKLAMVDSDKGITNLHAGNLVIIDASIPPMIRSGGKMWNADGKLEDTKVIIPDRCYGHSYNAAVEFCKKHTFNPATMGTVPNVGLMAGKAEEYGSHDKTFICKSAGTVKVLDASGTAVLESKVGKGDIYRGCQTKDIPIRDWVKLAVTRAKATGDPAVFWLDKNRAHDAALIKKVELYLKDHDTTGLEISIKPPAEAITEAMTRAYAGKNTITVTGNVLRDYNTDLFPILELNTSSKMLSIVPLLAGGGLYETGAGGSAPKHIQQFCDEGHLRWDSVGEYLALEPSLMDIGEKSNNPKAKVISECLGLAIEKYLLEDHGPSRKKGELGTRGSHFWLTYFWLKELAAQDKDMDLKAQFEAPAKAIEAQSDKIVDDLIKCQGQKMDIGGYYLPNKKKLASMMRPSRAFNDILYMISSWKKPPPLKKPKFGKVEKLNPESKAINLLLKSVSVKKLKDDEWDAVCGDASGRVTLRLRSPDQAALCEKEGTSLRLQNARVVMIDGFIRVLVDKWCAFKTADEALDFTVGTNDVSATEYELKGK